MTKRDITTWFCKVVALVGMVFQGFELLTGIGRGAVYQTSQAGFSLVPALPLALGFLLFIKEPAFYFFIWCLARGIGTEMVTRAEMGQLITDKRDLNALLPRCAGLIIFLWGAVRFSDEAVSLGQYFFYSRQAFRPPIDLVFPQFLWPGLLRDFVEVCVGAALAFGPRLRDWFHHHHAVPGGDKG